MLQIPTPFLCSYEAWEIRSTPNHYRVHGLNFVFWQPLNSGDDWPHEHYADTNPGYDGFSHLNPRSFKTLFLLLGIWVIPFWYSGIVSQPQTAPQVPWIENNLFKVSKGLFHTLTHNPICLQSGDSQWNWPDEYGTGQQPKVAESPLNAMFSYFGFRWTIKNQEQVTTFKI